MINTKFSDYKPNKKITTPEVNKVEVQTNRNLSRFIPQTRVLLILILIVQIAILYFVLSPLNLLQQLNVVQVINEVSKLTPVPPTEIPSVVAVIGDGTNLPDIDKIKTQNDYNAQVYKDAQNGDYVLAYTNKMIIYRKSTNTVIYNGDSPIALQNAQSTDLTNAVSKAAKAASIIPQDNTETPQLSVINDVTKLQGVNAVFYKDAKTGDIVAVYAQAAKIVIYRSSSDTIINSGDYSFVIK